MPPPARGSIFRIAEFPPGVGGEVRDNEAVLRDFGIGADVARGHPPRHPAIHRTRSLDYVVVLEGEISLLLDDSEVVLRAGDVVAAGDQPRLDQPQRRDLPPRDGVHRRARTGRIEVTPAIGLAWLTVAELSAHEQVTLAAQAGYSHVGLRLLPVANQLLPPFDERETGWRLANTGIKVLDVEVFRLAAETRISDFESTLAAAGRLGASQLLVHGDDPEEQRLVDSFGRLCDLAAPYGLAANIEPMPWVQIATVLKAKRILGGAARTNSGLLVDPIHFFRADNRFDELQGVRTNYLQFCDAPSERPSDTQEIIRQARSDRLFPGEGGLDLNGLLRALPADLPISVEVPYAKPMSALERAKRALAATRKLLLPRVA